ncbi:YciI family protein [Aneurinibacillus uraniidurans]|uniref:YciI family protein n=1 Tax=Aneurinibacillus uraniidurans TaxID=2966586 RepID=UPI002349FD0B|nr:YciI family protein [Aneurinibacillus sp. B1]WCN38303.1 YciI family protein [Aneurinibacillus sp. B1]
MHYAAFLPIIDQEKNKEHRPAHLAHINELFKQGKVMAAGPFTDGKGGLVIYIADTYEEALEMAEKDPAVTSGARTLELREWGALNLPLEG